MGHALSGQTEVESLLAALQNPVSVCLLKNSMASDHGSGTLHLHKWDWNPKNTLLVTRSHPSIGFGAVEAH